ncbi:hypothetical protein, partial [Helicobacter cinaedi]
SSGELQNLDRLYSKLYFSILKSIPKDTKQGWETRENLKAFNIFMMTYRDRQICPYLAVDTEAQEEAQKEVPLSTPPYELHNQFSGVELETRCIKRNYLTAIALLAYSTINQETLNQKLKNKIYGGLLPLRVKDMFYIRGLQKYNLYNQFFQDEDKERIINFYTGYCERIHRYNLYINYEYDISKDLRDLNHISICFRINCEYEVEYMENIIDDISLVVKNNKNKLLGN